MPWVRRHRKNRLLGVIFVMALAVGAGVILGAIWTVHLASQTQVPQLFGRRTIDLSQ
jgi:hypothetical protein